MLWAVEDAVERLDALACRLNILMDADKIQAAAAEPELYSDAWWAAEGAALRRAYDEAARNGHLIQVNRERRKLS